MGKREYLARKKKLKQQIKDKENDNIILKIEEHETKDKKEDENKILKQKIENLQAENEYFQQEYNMLQDNQYNYEELQKENKILQDNYLNLKSNFEIYTELINELRNENKELKKQIEDLKNENIDLYSNLI